MLHARPVFNQCLLRRIESTITPRATIHAHG